MFEEIEKSAEDTMMLAPNNHTSEFVSFVWDSVNED